MAGMSLTTTKHVMLSYQWDNKALVSRVYDTFKEKNIPVWMDEHDGVVGELFGDIAKAVENACILCCFLTPAYQASGNCKRELQYAVRQKIPFIPCISCPPSNSKWEPTEWLGLITAGVFYLTFPILPNGLSDDPIIQRLVKLVHRRVPSMQIPTGISVTPSPSQAPSSTVTAASGLNPVRPNPFRNIPARVNHAVPLRANPLGPLYNDRNVSMSVNQTASSGVKPGACFPDDHDDDQDVISPSAHSTAILDSLPPPLPPSWIPHRELRSSYSAPPRRLHSAPVSSAKK